MVSCVMGSRITVSRIMISRMRGGFITRPQVKSNALMCHRWQLATMNLDLYNFISSCNFCVYAANHAAFLPALYPSGCRRMKNIWITVFIVFLTTLLSMSSNLRFWTIFDGRSQTLLFTLPFSRFEVKTSGGKAASLNSEPRTAENQPFKVSQNSHPLPFVGLAPHY